MGVLIPPPPDGLLIVLDQMQSNTVPAQKVEVSVEVLDVRHKMRIDMICCTGWKRETFRNDHNFEIMMNLAFLVCCGQPHQAFSDVGSWSSSAEKSVEKGDSRIAPFLTIE
jgi:hypothetical protein